MNNQSPLIPQGILQDQKNQGRARVKIAVFVVLAIHGIGLLALLIVGCKDQPKTSQAQADTITNNTPAPQFDAASANPIPTNEPSTPSTQTSTGTPTLVMVPPATNPPVPESPTTPPAGATEYKIVQGDNFSTLAKKFHVTSKAISEANPGVEPTRLKIGQSIHIPAPAPSTPAVAAASVAPSDNSGETYYTVKSGENLTKIATDHKVSLKALRSVNGLTTDRIKVGQKLKIPTKIASTTTAGAAAGSGVSSPGTTSPASTTAAH